MRVLERSSAGMQVIAALQGLCNASIEENDRFDTKLSLEWCYDTFQRLRFEAHAPV